MARVDEFSQGLTIARRGDSRKRERFARTDQACQCDGAHEFGAGDKEPRVAACVKPGCARPRVTHDFGVRGDSAREVGIGNLSRARNGR